jgi:hypothetical protein
MSAPTPSPATPGAPGASVPGPESLTGLLATLEAAFPGARDEVLSALGLPPGSVVEEGVGAWYADRGEVLGLYLLSAGALTIHQRTQSGQTLTITVPVERISRLTLVGEQGRIELTLELDADQTMTSHEAEYVENPTGEGVTSGRQVARSVTRRASYMLGAATPGEISSLRRFHLLASALLHGR